jgi:hypothetical protein
MEDWADYITEQYEEYMEKNCICATSDQECPCMSFTQFESYEIQRLEAYWESLYEEVQHDIQEVLECKM